MAITGTVTTSATLTGGPSGNRSFTSSRTITAGVDQTLTVACTSGANTITVPTGSTFCGIFPPNAASPVPNPPNASTLTLKGVTGDTGVAISNTYPTYLEWDAATTPSTICITASGNATVEFFFA